MQQERFPEVVQVTHEASVGSARRAARRLAEALGYNAQTCEAIALTTTELATNLLKHAHGGKLTLTPISEGTRIGLQIETSDSGPGIQDVEQALVDGFSTAGSRGVGLGAVNRLMDELNITSPAGIGTRIMCRKWLRNGRISICSSPLDVGIATRARGFAEISANSFVLRQWEQRTLVGVIDGLVRGRIGHQAAQAARHYVETHFDLPLGKLFQGAERACRASRGVVMALACFDWNKHKVAVGSVGNVQIRVSPSLWPSHLRLAPRCIHVQGVGTVISERQWPDDSVMIIHSSGIRSDWSWNDFPKLTRQSASGASQNLLRHLANPEDDATIIVIKHAIIPDT